MVLHSQDWLHCCLDAFKFRLENSFVCQNLFVILKHILVEYYEFLLTVGGSIKLRFQMLNAIKYTYTKRMLNIEHPPSPHFGHLNFVLWSRPTLNHDFIYQTWKCIEFRETRINGQLLFCANFTSATTQTFTRTFRFCLCWHAKRIWCLIHQARWDTIWQTQLLLGYKAVLKCVFPLTALHLSCFHLCSFYFSFDARDKSDHHSSFSLSSLPLSKAKSCVSEVDVG